MNLESLALLGAAISLLIGSIFVLVGVIGLLKFSDPMTRLHAPTKVGTLGIGMLLVASMLTAAASGDPSHARASDHGVSICDGPGVRALSGQGQHPYARVHDTA